MLSHIGTNTIETERLILRRFKYSDNESMRKHWVSDINIQSMYREPIYSTKEEVDELLDRYISSYDKLDNYRWAIIDKNSFECIGQIAYYLVDNNNEFAEIEYCISSSFQCKGLATEATKAVISYGFNEINLYKIQICTMNINLASQKVIKKCGFVYEGTLRDFFLIDGKRFSRLYFSMLKSEYIKLLNSIYK